MSLVAFSVEILRPSGQDIHARQLLSIKDAGFLSGGEPLPGAVNSDGARPRSAVRLPDNLQQILDRFPDSQYAQWIRYWTLYHHGPVDDALQFAHDHSEFPLSDNLMLRMAEGLFLDRQYARAREVVQSISQTYPDGDTRVVGLAALAYD